MRMKQYAILFLAFVPYSIIAVKKDTTPVLKKKIHVPVKTNTPKVPVKVDPTILEASQQQQQQRQIGNAEKAYTWYLGQCTKNPIVTKSITCAIVCSIGDILAQKFESILAKGGGGGAGLEKVAFSLNFKRLTTFLLCGLFYVGPFVHLWYDLLIQMGRWMYTRYGASKFQQVLAQVFVDQTLGVVIFFPIYFYVFECMESLVKGRTPSLSAAYTKCRNDITKVVLMQYRIFPICNAINFAIIPEQLRVLFSNSISVFWNIYLCTILAE